MRNSRDVCFFALATECDAVLPHWLPTGPSRLGHSVLLRQHLPIRTPAMLIASTSRSIKSAISHCTFCGSRLRPAGESSRRLLSSQASASWSAGRHLPRWQSTNRSQRAAFSSIQQHNTPSIHGLPPFKAGSNILGSQGSRSYATIIELPTAAEDDLPEPLLHKGQEDANTTIAITPAAEKVS